MFLTLFLFFADLYLLKRLVRMYANPYRLFVVMGKKGCGKSTHISKMCYKDYLYQVKKCLKRLTKKKKKNKYVKARIKWLKNHIKNVRKGRCQKIRKSFIRCYSNVSSLKFCRYLEDDYYKHDYPQNSILFIDEAGLVHDNRDYKSFPKEARNFYKLQRHLCITIWIYSQSYDVDVKIRDLADGLYIQRCYLNILSVLHAVSRRITITEATTEKGSNIVEQYYYRPMIFFGKWLYIPFWVKKKLFNSFSRKI